MNSVLYVFVLVFLIVIMFISIFGNGLLYRIVSSRNRRLPTYSLIELYTLMEMIFSLVAIVMLVDCVICELILPKSYNVQLHYLRIGIGHLVRVAVVVCNVLNFFAISVVQLATSYFYRRVQHCIFKWSRIATYLTVIIGFMAALLNTPGLKFPHSITKQLKDLCHPVQPTWKLLPEQLRIAVYHATTLVILWVPSGLSILLHTLTIVKLYLVSSRNRKIAWERQMAVVHVAVFIIYCLPGVPFAMLHIHEYSNIGSSTYFCIKAHRSLLGVCSFFLTIRAFLPFIFCKFDPHVKQALVTQRRTPSQNSTQYPQAFPLANDV